MRRTIGLLACVLLLAVFDAAAGSMTLTPTGDLYRVAVTEDGLTITHRPASGETTHLLVPQTTGIAASALNLAVDETSNSIFVLWQRSDEDSTRVEFAASTDGTWYGPFTLAGGDGSLARFPEMLLDRVSTTIEIPPEDEGGEPSSVELSTTFLHIVWWHSFAGDDRGAAYLVSLPLFADGMPDLDAFSPVALSDLLPYGIGCSGLEETDQLAHPRLYLDPQSGNPHVLATDLTECLFQILRISYDVVEEPTTKRRRHITVWNTEGMIGVDAALPLGAAQVEAGRDLSVVLYWDAAEAVEYLRLTESVSSGIQSLALGDDLDREQAVELIRALVR